MNIPRYIGRRIKGGANKLAAAAVQIAIIAIGVALGIVIAAPLLTG